MTRLTHVTAIIGAGTIAAPALGFVNGMQVSNTPSTYASSLQSLDIASTTWSFPVGSGKLDSGYKAEILDPGGNPLALDPGINPNSTSLISEVFSVSSPTSIGGVNLVTNDLVFAYHLRMVASNGNTVPSLREFSVKGATGIFGTGDGFFDSSIVLGRGYSLSGLANPATFLPIPGNSAGNGTDLETQDFGALGGFSQLDFSWSSADENQLMNAQQITLLVFARNAAIGNGFAKFFGNSLGVQSTTDSLADDAPILIPIPVPTPATFGMLAIGGGFLCSRRRR